MKDDAFIRGKNPMTKMEIRSTIIDYLELESAKIFLEIGAVTCSFSIQMQKPNPQLKYTLIEQTESGCELILQNAKKHGVNNITLHQASAPMPLEGAFDRIYIGGSGANLIKILRWLEDGLMMPDARLVFSTLTIENTSFIFDHLFNHPSLFFDIEGSQIQASRLETLGRYHYFKPLNPCTIIKCLYGGIHE